MKTGIKQNIVYKFLISLFVPLFCFFKELFNACKGRRLTVLWVAVIFCFIYIGSDYYVKKLQSKIGFAVDISNISSNDHIFFKINKGVKSYNEINIGEYIAFKTNKLEPFVSRDYSIVKKVMAKHGDHIQIKGMDVLINGKKAAELNPIALKKINKSVEQMQTSYVVQENSFFLLGSYSRSYDSRYWGGLEIKQSQLLDVATPVLF